MTKLEQIEKLRERANVTYDEAKEAYEAVEGDLLDALIYLEKQGKVRPPHGDGYYSSERTNMDHAEGENYEDKDKDTDNFMKSLEKIGKFFINLVEKGNSTYFEIKKGQEYQTRVPVTVLVILALFLPYITFPLIVIGLLFGFNYRFIGFNFTDDQQ